jgi:hypothetical protein
MFKKVIFVFAVFLLFPNLYSAEFEKHILGFGVEGGISRSFLNSQCNCSKPYNNLYGTVGGNFFYQYRFNEVFALRSGVAVYSYFFDLYGPINDEKKDKIFATVHSRIDLTIALYAYTGWKFSIPILLTPLFVSMIFYDSAGTYERDLGDTTEETEVMHNFGAFVGGQVAIGIERSNPRKTGVGFYLFMRMSDAMLGTGGQSGIPCSMGGNFTLFW